MSIRKNDIFSIATIGAVLGALGILSGAFGAHALKAGLVERGMTTVWETAVLFHLIHAVIITALGWTAGPVSWSSRAGITATSWILGTLLFSGSLYLLAAGGPRAIGPVTPVGGLFLLVGWILAITLRPGRPVQPT